MTNDHRAASVGHARVVLCILARVAIAARRLQSEVEAPNGNAPTPALPNPEPQRWNHELLIWLESVGCRDALEYVYMNRRLAIARLDLDVRRAPRSREDMPIGETNHGRIANTHASGNSGDRRPVDANGSDHQWLRRP